MKRILAVDFGTRRVGLAVTDTLQIAAHGLTTVTREKAVAYILDYVASEPVGSIVIGRPEKPGQAFVQSLRSFVKHLKKELPEVQIVFEEEDMTSQEAFDMILAAGVRRKARKDKGLIDQVSAVLILQRHLEHNNDSL